MKVVLLLVAVYALIINQALKQVESKEVIREVKKESKINEPSHYINAALIPVSPFTIESEVRPALMDLKTPGQPAHLLTPVIYYPEIYKGKSSFYPVNVTYQSDLDKKRS